MHTLAAPPSGPAQLPYAESSRFARVRQLGRGAFGEVYLAKDGFSGDLVALKHIPVRTSNAPQDLPKAVFREIQALQRCAQRNLLTLLAVVPGPGAVDLVLELAPVDLAAVVDAATPPIPVPVVKGLMHGICVGLAAMHHDALLHRDIKPGNVLLTLAGVVKLADFGLARVQLPDAAAAPEDEAASDAAHAEPGDDAGDPLHGHGGHGGAPLAGGWRPEDQAEQGGLTAQVATRWYRSPELLYGARFYAGEVDVWAAGCILAELILLRPLFRGASDIDQLSRIIRGRGAPSDHLWPEARKLPDYDKLCFPETEPLPIQELLCPCGDVILLRFAEGLLELDPKRRMTSAAAAVHEVFYMAPDPASEAELANYVSQDLGLGLARAGRR